MIEDNIHLAIPWTLMLVDMINRGVLTPKEMMAQLCGGDYAVVAAYHITRQIGEFPTDCSIQEEIGLFLCGAAIAYKYLTEKMDADTFGESLAEILLWADDPTEDSKEQLKKYPQASQMLTHCEGYIREQLDEFLLNIRDCTRLYLEITQDYHELAELAEEMLPMLTYHREVIGGDS